MINWISIEKESPKESGIQCLVTYNSTEDIEYLSVDLAETAGYGDVYFRTVSSEYNYDCEEIKGVIAWAPIDNIEPYQGD